MEPSRNLRPHLHSLFLLSLGALANPLWMELWLPAQSLQKLAPFLWCFSMLALGLSLRSWFAGRSISDLWRHDAVFNLLLFLGAFALVLVSNRLYATQFKVLRVLIYLALIVKLLHSFSLVAKLDASQKWVARLATSAFGLALLWIVLEIIFLFVTRSQGANPDAFSHLNWVHQNWGLRNSYGVVEREIAPKGRSRRVFVLGDSFTAGQGVAVHERYGNVLGYLLGDNWDVYSFGYPGENTAAERRHLDELKSMPDVLVLGYCLNDIQTAAKEEGIIYPWVSPASRIPWLVRPLLHYSHFLNYLYASLAYGGDTQMPLSDFIGQCFASKSVLHRHFAELQTIIDFAFDHGIRLEVIVFPLMQDPSGSKEFTQQITHYFVDQGIPTIDLGIEVDSLLIAGHTREELRVNPTDWHPSKFVHALAARKLAALLGQLY